ncbi:MAG: hypothetical protein EXS52_00850 [Candidatus Staskawiczbacteria bacterium]|nr:hypothetical protein [Candidatus Staskawiczbacteria bacterium]
MNWFFIAILGPLFWSFSNHTDKFLLNKQLKGIGKEALVLYSTLFGLVVLPVAYFFNQDIFSIGFFNVVILIIAGCLSSLAIYCYLYALEGDEASVVVPFWQTIPVFGFVLGFLFFGEILTINQYVGSFIVILGAAFLSLEISELKTLKIKRKIAILMLASSLLFAFYETLFKVVATDGGFWVSTFWQYTGLFVFGVMLFSSRKKYRADFLFLIKRHSWNLFSINIINEGTTIIGNTFYNFSLLLAPLALVMVTTGYQPIFVFLEGVLLTLFFPRISRETLSIKHVAHKLVSIAIVFIGTYFMYT